MIILGIVLFLIGATAELIGYLRGAWPTMLTWILIGLGLLAIAVGSTRAKSVWRRLTVSALVLLVVGVGVAWLLG